MKKSTYFCISIFIVYNFFSFSVKADPIFEKGKDIFLNKAMCSSCHTLAEAGSNAPIGPNLNEIRPDKMRVINAVTNGIGVMPPYEGELTPEEIESVAYYVSLSADM